MFCPSCGTKLEEGIRFCENCGKSISGTSAVDDTPKTVVAPSFPKKKSSITPSRAIWALVILGIIGYSIYNSQDQNAITANNQALNSYESGNNQQAINQLNSASQQAVTNDTKINVLKNLAYAYEVNGQNSEALTSFQQALNTCPTGVFRLLPYFRRNSPVAKSV